MSIETAQVCSLCRKEVPSKCDGNVYMVRARTPGQITTCRGDDSAGWCLRTKNGRTTYSLFPNDDDEKFKHEAVLIQNHRLDHIMRRWSEPEHQWVPIEAVKENNP